MKLVTSALGRWGLEWLHSSTWAKVQIFFGRRKLGHRSDLGGSGCQLTEFFFTKGCFAAKRLLI